MKYNIVQDYNREIRFGPFKNQTKNNNNRDRYRNYFTFKNIDHIQEDQFGYKNKNGGRV